MINNKHFLNVEEKNVNIFYANIYVNIYPKLIDVITSNEKPISSFFFTLIYKYNKMGNADVREMSRLYGMISMHNNRVRA